MHHGGRILFLLAGAALAAGGCGGSSSSAPSSSSSSGSAARSSSASSRAGASAKASGLVGPPPAALAGVRGRVLTAGEMPGYTPQGRRLLGINAHSWVIVDQTPGSQQAKEAAFLGHLRFVAGLREDLAPSAGNGAGLSTVEEFRSAAAARTELAAVVRNYLATVPGSAPFAAPGIPGARGFGVSDSATTSANVAFAVGRYCYLVGVGGAPGAPAGPIRAVVIAGGRHLHGRVA